MVELGRDEVRLRLMDMVGVVCLWPWSWGKESNSGCGVSRMDVWVHVQMTRR